MAKLLIEAMRPYHSNTWPHAKKGDRVWGDSNMLRRLERDTGPGWFKIVEIVDDRGVINVEAHRDGSDNPDGAKAPPETPPKKKRGRPKKKAVSDGKAKVD